MNNRLPPLTALRAFDAAARHLSFSKAAEELHVTPAALSFQIKSLEEHLGGAVFRRLNRAVELTEIGQALAPGTRDGFEQLGIAWARARRLLDTNTLNVTAGPALTAKWLAPRIRDFALAHPGVELRFTASLRLMDFDRDGIDVAIRFGYGDNPELYSLPLAREWLTPVMLPELAKRYPTPDSLRRAPLIDDQSIDFLRPRANWAAWFRAAGMDFAPEPVARFSHADHALDAVLSGAGIGLGRRAFVVKDIDEGRLVAPFRTAIGTHAQFRFLCPKGHEERPNIQAFRDWMLTEIDKHAHITERFEITDVEEMTDT